MARNYLINKHMDDTVHIMRLILGSNSGSLVDRQVGCTEGEGTSSLKEKVTTHLGAGSNKKITALPPSNYLQDKSMEYIWQMSKNTGIYLSLLSHDRHIIDTWQIGCHAREKN